MDFVTLGDTSVGLYIYRCIVNIDQTITPAYKYSFISAVLPKTGKSTQ